MNIYHLNLKPAFLALFLATQILLTAGAGQAQEVISTESSTVGGDLTRIVTIIQNGASPLDKFTMTKVVKSGLPQEPIKGAILLLPPLGSGFQNYEATANGDYNDSFVAFFARRNFVIFGYSPRQNGLVAGSCESGAIDCSPMANWGLETIGNDVEYIRAQIALQYPDLKVVVGGLSMGSITAQVALNEHPDDYAGAILIEGTIHDPNPAVRAVNTNFCSTAEAMLAAGVYYDGQSGPAFKALNQAAQATPNAPNVFPGFPPGLTFHQAFVLAMSAPPVSPLTPRPGYFNAAGSFVEDRFFYVNEPLLHANVSTFIDYAPIKSLRDLNCGLAGETTFTNNLGSFNGPVIMFAGGHGFGSAMFSTAQLMTSADVTINFKAEYGHVDYMFSNKHAQELEHPILRWLLQNPFKQ